MPVSTLVILALTFLWYTVLSLPTFKIQRCEHPPPPGSSWQEITSVKDFILADGSTRAKQQTTVFMCYNSQWIYIKFNCSDNHIYSPFTKCNQPLYQYDVVEVFLTSPTTNNEESNLHNYVELEVSPNGILFVSRINNTLLRCGGFIGTEIPCNETGILWYAARYDSKNNWWAYLQIPWRLLNFTAEIENFVETQSRKINWRGNFYRIDSPKNLPKEYSCWSPTMSTPPCFHKPAYFGYLDLE